MKLTPLLRVEEIHLSDVCSQKPKVVKFTCGERKTTEIPCPCYFCVADALDAPSRDIIHLQISSIRCLNLFLTMLILEPMWTSTSFCRKHRQTISNMNMYYCIPVSNSIMNLLYAKIKLMSVWAQDFLFFKGMDTIFLLSKDEHKLWPFTDSEKASKSPILRESSKI